MQFGWVNMHTCNFFVCWPKFANFFSRNVGGVVVDQLLFRFSICWSVPEIFAIEVDSCLKLRQILDVFCPPKFYGEGLPQKLCPIEHPWLVARSVVKFCDLTPTSCKVIGAHTLNFEPNFTCSPLNVFWGGPPSPLGMCASKPWSICSAC